MAVLRIPIMYDRSRPPYVKAQVRWDMTGASASVNLVVDTGAFDITLSMWDVQALEVARGRLESSQFPVSGIGGAADTFVMKGVSIAFVGSGIQDAVFRLGDVNVLDDSGLTSGRGLPLRIPSLLGRKFMEDHGFILHWDFARRIAYIDIAEPGQRHGWRLPTTSGPSRSTS